MSAQMGESVVSGVGVSFGAYSVVSAVWGSSCQVRGSLTSPSLSLQHPPAPGRGEADLMGWRPAFLQGCQESANSAEVPTSARRQAVPVLAPNEIIDEGSSLDGLESGRNHDRTGPEESAQSL